MHMVYCWVRDWEKERGERTKEKDEQLKKDARKVKLDESEKKTQLEEEVKNANLAVKRQTQEAQQESRAIKQREADINKQRTQAIRYLKTCAKQLPAPINIRKGESVGKCIIYVRKSLTLEIKWRSPGRRVLLTGHEVNKTIISSRRK